MSDIVRKLVRWEAVLKIHLGFSVDGKPLLSRSIEVVLRPFPLKALVRVGES